MRSPIVVVYQSIANLSFQKLLRLFLLLVSHPLFSLMGFWATIKAFGLAQQKFPSSASGNGIGNAFRHALWTALIMAYCSKISSPQKAKIFCLKMTNLHEELFPNDFLEKQMDVHNNQIGISLFFEMLPGIHRQFFETSFIVEKLMIKIQSAVLVTKANEFMEQELVYIAEDNHSDMA
ncbi:MAG: hypothetical protein JSS94_08000 [Bacteroidetes bacterium]|nr:hypothetical protein [Bacteroidota bacterium]